MFSTSGMPTAAQLNRLGRAVARGRRIITSTVVTSTTDIGVLRNDAIAVTSGTLYVIASTPLALDSSVANDEIGARIRYTTTGVAATTASTILPGSQVAFRQVDINVPEPKMIFTTYTPSVNETLSLLLCVRRIAGTGNATIFADGTDIIQLLIFSLGTDPGDSGVDI